METRPHAEKIPNPKFKKLVRTLCQLEFTGLPSSVCRRPQCVYRKDCGGVYFCAAGQCLFPQEKHHSRS